MDNALVKSPYQFGYDAHAQNINSSSHDQGFIEMHLKGLKVGESLEIINQWNEGFQAANEKYLRENFPEMY
ncbi:hypothetical protein IRT38_01095 (plasmid) [Acinetobacter sp. SK-43]|uniref:hypothetical protein n=1 Tax=Acinetobacter sp. SK-43 TaxID=2785295 RepID=UPI00188ABFAC|nr:hypothetical protein [Acinetobacter sp. SK-43]MBF4454013.1 hypothetical protein [Acinetobacter sp. SK-43]